jgi:hypothetical protein
MLWVFVQAWALRHGPIEVYDSARYLRHAALLAHGQGTDAPAHHQRYIGYALYLSAFVRYNLPLWWPVAGQVLLNGAATLAYFRTIRRVTNGQSAPAVAATFLTLLWTDLQRFSAYILTESLFTSALLLALAALTWALYTPRTTAVHSVGRGLLVVSALIAVTVARPNGFLVPAAAAFAGLAWAWRAAHRWGRAILVVAVAGAGVAVWPVLNIASATYGLIETYCRGDIIGGYPGWHIRAAAPLLVPAENLPQLTRVAAFAAAQPSYFGQLALAKIGAFILYVKPFWSPAHNIAAALILWPAWFFAARGLRQHVVRSEVQWFASALLLGQAAMVAVTIEDWDARFLTPLLPLVFGLAALGWRNMEQP